MRIGHYLNLGLGPDGVTAFQQARPAVQGRVALFLTACFVGGLAGLFVGVWGAWSGNGFDGARVFSADAVTPAYATVWGWAGVGLLAVFLGVLGVARRSAGRAAEAFDAVHAVLWEQSGRFLVLVDGFSGEADDVMVRLGALADEVNERWPSGAPSAVRELFVTAARLLAEGSAGAASLVLDGVAGVLGGEVAASAP